jgi:hypothetical protein
MKVIFTSFLHRLPKCKLRIPAWLTLVPSPDRFLQAVDANGEEYIVGDGVIYPLERVSEENIDELNHIAKPPQIGDIFCNTKKQMLYHAETGRDVKQ